MTAAPCIRSWILDLSTRCCRPPAAQTPLPTADAQWTVRTSHASRSKGTF